MNDAPVVAATEDAAARSAGRRRWRLVLLLLVPLIGAGLALLIYLYGGRHVETDNAYVKADKVPVSAAVAGTVSEVLVGENQAVAAGQLLFRLDAAPFRVAVAAAEAKVAQTRTDHSALQAAYRQKQAEIALARTRAGFARQEQQRQADLVARGFVSTSRFDDARQTGELAAQQVTVLEEELKRIAMTLGGSIDTPLAQRASMQAAQAELERARLDLARADVRASLPGIISKPPKLGQYIAAGSIAMALVVNATPWVEANFTETDLTHLRPGQPAEVHIDTYPGIIWRGTVDSVSPATGAEFALIPSQNATGNWVKVVQRVPVRIDLEVAPGQPVLRAGLSAAVKIDTGRRRQLFGLALPDRS